MADAKIIDIDSERWDIKDQTARTRLTEQQENIDTLISQMAGNASSGLKDLIESKRSYVKKTYQGSQTLRNYNISEKLIVIASLVYSGHAGVTIIASNYNSAPSKVDLIPNNLFKVTASYGGTVGTANITVTTTSNYSWILYEF